MMFWCYNLIQIIYKRPSGFINYAVNYDVRSLVKKKSNWPSMMAHHLPPKNCLILNQSKKRGKMDTSTVSDKNGTFGLEVAEQKSLAAFVKGESSTGVQTPSKLAGSKLAGSHCLTREYLFRHVEK